MIRLKNIKFVACSLILCSLSSCSKEDLVGYTGGETVGFWIHSKNHSLYGMTESEMPRDTIVLDLAVTGEISDRDRTVAGYAIPDKEGTEADKRLTTAVESQDYNLLGGVIPANNLYGQFKVEIINHDILKDSELKLHLGIQANEDFIPGLSENRSIRLAWTQKIMKPSTWNQMALFFCSTYSTQVYKVFMQATGLKEFYYYRGDVELEEAYVMGKTFGDIVRQYEIDHGTPMLHDDGPSQGLPIIPLH